MSGDIKHFLEQQRLEILKEKQRLEILESLLLCENKENVTDEKATHFQKFLQENDQVQHEDYEKPNESVFLDTGDQDGLLKSQKSPPVVEPLDLSGCNEKDNFFLDRSSARSLSYRTSDDTTEFGLFRSGAAAYRPAFPRRDGRFYSSVRAAPHQGLGEYDVIRGDQRFYTTKNEGSAERTVTDNLVDKVLDRKRPYSSNLNPFRIDQRLTTAQNDAILKAATSNSVANMDKPKGILSNRRTGGSPRGNHIDSIIPAITEPISDRYHNDYGTYLDGFSYSDRSEDLERERLKREAYQRELRLQIEEKRQLAALREKQDRRERELENRRLERQLVRMRDEQTQDEQWRQRRNELMRRHSDDLLRRKTELHELNRPWRRHADSESVCVLDSGSGLGQGRLGSYSPPVTRRTLAPLSPFSSSYNQPPVSVFSESNKYNSGGGILRKPDYTSSSARPLESTYYYDTVPFPHRTGRYRSKFDRFDSLSRIDSLGQRLETMSVRDGYSSDHLTDIQRRHSVTQQDLSLNKSPRMHRRNSSSRFEESTMPFLPAPVLKARSPVAKELRNAVPFSSNRVSDYSRKFDVGMGLSSSLDSPVGSRGSILTQLGSIRAQLQREQLRMDETLRRRGGSLVRTRTIDDY
ncbi:hypothetical protein ABEB36_006573 [Hypothenemus hampei]|uniref:Uncharacterized protein n=1 Tax=Hypothenemus hampei TaxID=57062 RepID=A0ABD1ER03_HYPHA